MGSRCWGTPICGGVPVRPCGCGGYAERSAAGVSPRLHHFWQCDVAQAVVGQLEGTLGCPVSRGAVWLAQAPNAMTGRQGVTHLTATLPRCDQCCHRCARCLQPGRQLRPDSGTGRFDREASSRSREGGKAARAQTQRNGRDPPRRTPVVVMWKLTTVHNSPVPSAASPSATSPRNREGTVPTGAGLQGAKAAEAKTFHSACTHQNSLPCKEMSATM